MLHMLTSSKLVAMGISVVNLALGTNFKAYSNVATFHRKLVEHGGGAALKR